jgi:hypothetical protein
MMDLLVLACLVLLKGKAQYDLLPCINLFNLLIFKIENINRLFTKQANLMKRSTVLSLPLQLVFPGLIHSHLII